MGTVTAAEVKKHFCLLQCMSVVSLLYEFALVYFNWTIDTQNKWILILCAKPGKLCVASVRPTQLRSWSDLLNPACFGKQANENRGGVTSQPIYLG